MKEIGSAPTVEEFAVRADGLAGRRTESCLERIPAHHRFHNLGVGPDWIASDPGAEVTEHQTDRVGILPGLFGQRIAAWGWRGR